MSNSSFYSQAVLPDDSPVPGPRWSASNGGCEGISHADALRVPSTTIYRNNALYDAYTDSFPFLPSSAEDRPRLLSRLGLISGVVRSTTAWVKDFVLGYNLCPFAEDVFGSERIRYRVFLGGSENVDKIIDRVRYEMLALLTAKEEDVATTLLVLPFAGFGSFDEWHQFSLALEDAVMPALEQELQGPALESDGQQQQQQQQRKRLLQKVANRSKPSAPTPLPDIQLAFFHPSFCWSNAEEYNSAINFEKRAPFPTINLLRAARIRQWASEGKTKKIASSNADSLAKAGEDELNAKFEAIIRLALD